MHGQCIKLHCSFNHSIDSKMLLELAQKWLLAKEFLSLKNLLVMMSSPSSPFRKSLKIESGRGLLRTIISTLLDVILKVLLTCICNQLIFIHLLRRKIELS